MTTTTAMTTVTESRPEHTDAALLAPVVRIVRDAGNRLLDVFSTDARPSSREDLFAAARRNEDISAAGLREALHALRPQAGWVTDELETVELPPGEWWTVDAVEGNVNHLHGLPEWCVTVTLVRDNIPVLTAVYQPVPDLLYTAVRGSGAHVNGTALRASGKAELDVAIAATGQAEAGQDATFQRIGTSIGAMLGQALLVRATVPSTFPMLLVASGQVDLFWQYAPVLPGIAAGVLLVTEAGGVVSDTHGRAWQPGASDILLAAPDLHRAAADVLSSIA